MQHFPQDFYLGISYREPGKGSYPRVTVPGFYLHAEFANEGCADRYTGADPNGIRLNDATLHAIIGGIINILWRRRAQEGPR